MPNSSTVRAFGVAVKAKTGEEAWSFNAACSGITSSVVADGKLFVPANGVTALDVEQNGAPGDLVALACEHGKHVHGFTPVYYSAERRAAIATAVT